MILGTSDDWSIDPATQRIIFKIVGFFLSFEKILLELDCGFLKTILYHQFEAELSTEIAVH